MTVTTCPTTKTCPIAPAPASCVLNRDGLVFIGRRTERPEHIDATHVWQMPQGGIDEGEDPYPAALRELYEETNIRSVEKLGEIADWLTYDIPREIVGAGLERQISRAEAEMVRAALHRRRQRDRHRRIRAAAHEPEFVEWRWEPMESLPDLVVPFKRQTYERVVGIREFASKFSATR